jgi:high-affinity iron transporter
MAQAAASASGWAAAGGALLGLAAATALGWAIFRGGKRISLQRFFAVTSVLLLLVAAGMFSTGIGKLEALAVLPQSTVLWDTSTLLSDQSFLGTFLGGLAGYRARPSVAEVTSHVAYLVIAGALLFGKPRRAAKAGPRGGPVPAGAA